MAVLKGLAAALTVTARAGPYEMEELANRMLNPSGHFTPTMIVYTR